MGLVSTGAALIVALTGFTSQNVAGRGPFLVVSLVSIYLLSRSKLIYRLIKILILKMLARNSPLELKDYYDILGLGCG